MFFSSIIRTSYNLVSGILHSATLLKMGYLEAINCTFTLVTVTYMYFRIHFSYAVMDHHSYAMHQLRFSIPPHMSSFMWVVTRIMETSCHVVSYPFRE